MKVRCVRLLDKSGREQTSSAWLTVGRVYVVLSLYVASDGNSVQIMGDQGPGPGIYRLDQFELVDGSIPAIWVASKMPRGNGLSLEPAAWAPVGFWDKYFDGDPEARAVFQQVLAKLTSDEPMDTVTIAEGRSNNAG
jgi:hypothetical protein